MTIEELEQIAQSVRLENEKYDFEVNVCLDLACASQGAEKLRAALAKAAEVSGGKILVRKTGCMGPCSSGRWSASIPRQPSTTTSKRPTPMQSLPA